MKHERSREQSRYLERDTRVYWLHRLRMMYTVFTLADLQPEQQGGNPFAAFFRRAGKFTAVTEISSFLPKTNGSSGLLPPAA